METGRRRHIISIRPFGSSAFENCIQKSREEFLHFRFAQEHHALGAVFFRACQASMAQYRVVVAQLCLGPKIPESVT
jgi:hypothetical protein